jgi:osmotically-inducible protein OsmY
MTTASITGTDIRVRGAVVRQLDWDPEVDASAIGVSAADGVVTLTGFAESYAEKLAAERVAKQVRGVRGVARPHGSTRRADRRARYRSAAA